MRAKRSFDSSVVHCGPELATEVGVLAGLLVGVLIGSDSSHGLLNGGGYLSLVPFITRYPQLESQVHLPAHPFPQP